MHCAKRDECYMTVYWPECASFSIRLCLVQVQIIVCLGMVWDVFVTVRPRATNLSTVDPKHLSLAKSTLT